MSQNAHTRPSFTPSGPVPIVLIIAALWIFWGFGYEAVWQRLTTQVEGTIVSSKDVPPTRGGRYVTKYIVRGTDGQDRPYVAGPTDASLERSMLIGTRIRKEWGELGYEKDGERVGFPLYAYSATFGIALGCLLWACLQWRHSR